jgi:hypothetical protein
MIHAMSKCKGRLLSWELGGRERERESERERERERRDRIHVVLIISGRLAFSPL